jgi:hypothetical protein
MSWVGQVACMGEMRDAYTSLVENSKKIDRLLDIGVDGKIILKWTLNVV